MRQTFFLLLGFGIIAVAANQIARLFTKIHLPFITGTLIIGIITGPYLLNLIPQNAGLKLHFLENIALAFIAYAAGSELHLEELRSRIKSIIGMTFWQVLLTFGISAGFIFFISEYIPFMNTMNNVSRIAIALLMGTIFIARSPASAIAVIREMRARGPFTKTAMGVTVLTDVIVIILFAITFSVASLMTTASAFELLFIVGLLINLALSFAFGIGLGKLLSWLLSIGKTEWIKTSMVLLSGLGVYILVEQIGIHSDQLWHFNLHPEPLLICIIGSFIVTNYSKSKAEFIKIIHESGTPVYVVFFTLTGASMALDVLSNLWELALLLFGIRILAIACAGLIGGVLHGDPWRFNMTAWTPYVTQAGVSLGLTAIIAETFTGWGPAFEALIIAVIVISQFVGPPLFKWSLQWIGESHNRADKHAKQDRTVMIFGLNGSSIALAKQLTGQGWEATIISNSSQVDTSITRDIRVISMDSITKERLKEAGADRVDTIVCMFRDDHNNYKICETAYEFFGTREIITMLHDRKHIDLFKELGVLIVDPTSAMISLLDHMVRSPHATNLLLGAESNQDTVDLVVQNKDLHGLALRDLRLPKDIIILSICRGDQMIISHGYTRLRLGDMVTLVGSVKSIETSRLLFG